MPGADTLEQCPSSLSYDQPHGSRQSTHQRVAATSTRLGAIVGQALAAQRFELIPPIIDARRSTILGGVRELVRRLNGAGSGAIGFIYYSGLSAAEKDTNINYLIPIDAKEPRTTAFWDESIKLDDVLRLLDGARSAAKFAVFDACRNELPAQQGHNKGSGARRRATRQVHRVRHCARARAQSRCAWQSGQLPCPGVFRCPYRHRRCWPSSSAGMRSPACVLWWA